VRQLDKRSELFTQLVLFPFFNLPGLYYVKNMEFNMKVFTAISVIVILSACAVATPIPVQPTPTIHVIEPTTTIDPLAELRQQAKIKMEDNGKTFTFAVASRFFVFLDDMNYPATELTCSPEGIIGLISNGSLRGPGLYPVMFEGAQVGKCMLTDRDFSVQIEIK
jgi:hypothetical protein